MRVYLAGPDVFLPDPVARGAALKAVCARHGLTGVFPLDPFEAAPVEWDALPLARRIALGNEAHIRGADVLIANLTPFRGPSADAGTVFELGFARALGRPVFGWSNTAVPFTERTVGFLGAQVARNPGGGWTDGDGLLVESFGMSDNLMIDGAVLASGGMLSVHEAAADARWSDLAAFERCVMAAARLLMPTR